MRTLPSYLVYGVAGFGAGFVLGAVREIVLIPTFGEVRGQWFEFVPLAITITLIGFWVTRRWKISQPAKALATGFLAVGVLLVIESSFALFVLRIPFEEYLASFNIFEGKLFPFGLLIMALAPLLGQIFFSIRN